ncbi:UNVERIFIED_CONTAM: hypothetical protein FKN15_000062 [Acipenser sinensis]
MRTHMEVNLHLSRVRCCEPAEKLTSSFTDNLPNDYPSYPLPHIRTTIDVTILKGDKGENGEKGLPGKSGKEGPRGPQGLYGFKGMKGQVGPPGNSCKQQYSAFSVSRKKSLHSRDYFQELIFDTVFVNLYKNFNVFTGKFSCYTLGPSDHSSMQSQSLLLDLQEEDEVWIRLDNTDGENAVYSDASDVYITFNGYLIKSALE